MIFKELWIMEEVTICQILLAMHQSSLLFGFVIVVVIWLCRRCLILLNLFNWIIDWMDDWSIFVDICWLLNCWAGS